MDDPLTEAEEAFQALLHDPPRYRKWAERTRERWERSPAGKAAVERRYRDVGGFRMGEEQAGRRRSA